jgi:hypothetical protein
LALMKVELLSHWQPTVIKGNAAEIGALAKSTEVNIFLSISKISAPELGH